MENYNFTRNEWIDERPVNAGIFPLPPRQVHIRFCRHWQMLSSDGMSFHQRSSLLFRKRPKVDMFNLKEGLCPWQSTEKSEKWSCHCPSIWHCGHQVTDVKLAFPLLLEKTFFYKHVLA